MFCADRESASTQCINPACVCCLLAAVQVRIDKFTVEVDPQQLPGGTRYYLVQGEAIERFAQV